MSFENLPKKVFLDTSVVNFILDYGEEIFDGYGEQLSRVYITRDIIALRNIFMIGKRANIQLAISQITFSEVCSTKDATKRLNLQQWFYEIYDHWVQIVNADDNMPNLAEAELERSVLLESISLDILPDKNDRMLIFDAMIYRCDHFCTRDWNTILKKRKHLNSLPIRIISPWEWWEQLKPYAALWF